MGANFKHKLLIAMSLFKPDAENHARANELARDNADDATLDEAESKIRTAQIRVVTLSAAPTETDQQILQLEQELVAVADRKQREAAAFEIEKAAEGFASAAADAVRSL